MSISTTIFGIFTCSTLSAHNPNLFNNTVYIDPYLDTADPRYPSTSKSIKILNAIEANVLLQINVTPQKLTANSHPDYSMASIYAHWALLNNAKFNLAFAYWTEPTASVLALSYLQPFIGASKIVSNNPYLFLTTLFSPIDFLYLDTTHYQQVQSDEFQQNLLDMVKMATPKMNLDNGLILIGNLPNEGHKCPALRYLKKKGWKIVEKDFQFILKHSSSEDAVD